MTFKNIWFDLFLVSVILNGLLFYCTMNLYKKLKVFIAMLAEMIRIADLEQAIEEQPDV